MTNRERELADSGLEYAEGLDRIADEQANAELDARATEMMNGVLEHPKCSHCGGTDFQIVEDLPILYRSHEWKDGKLVFTPECDEKCWDGSGCTYRYLECRSCTTQLDGVAFEFDDGQDQPLVNRGNPHKVAIVIEGGLVRDVFATDKLDVEILDCDEIEFGDDEDAAEMDRIAERVEELCELNGDPDSPWRVVY